MRYLPIELDVQGREALVLGAHGEVVSKIARLLDAGARVTLVAEGPLPPEIEAWAASGTVTVRRRAFQSGDLEGKLIVFAAPFFTPEEEALARSLHAEALQSGRLFCAIDRPEASTFVNAAVARATSLIIAISTEGVSPSAARRLREDLEAVFADPRWERFITTLRSLRPSLPRGERATRMARAIHGFALDAKLRFPDWLDRDEAP